MEKPLVFRLQTTVKATAIPLTLSFSLLFLLLAYAIMDNSGILSKEINEVREKKKCLQEIRKIEELIIDSLTRLENIAGVHVFDESDTIEVKRIRWGLFEMFGIYPKGNFKSYAETFIICEEHVTGQGWFTGNSDITLSGQTKLKGEIGFRRKFKKSRIEGQLFKGDLTESTLQEDREFKGNTTSLFYIPEKQPTFSQTQLIATQINDFNSKPILFHSSQAVDLTNCALKGNIVIESSKSINIESSSKLENIILSAPEIHIKDNFSGIIQCNASEKIIVGKNVRLQFPSALYLEGIKSKSILCDGGTTIDGIVAIVLPENFSHRPLSDLPVLTISKNSVISGELICEGIVNNEGVVKGMFIINSPVAYLGSTLYMNCMANGTCDASVRCHSLLAGKWENGKQKMGNEVESVKRRIAKKT